MASRNIIYMDMDGVVADFVSSALKVFGASDTLLSENRGKFELFSMLGVSSSEFWNTIHEHPTFWHDLEPTQEAYHLMDHAESLLGTTKSIYFLTSPAFHPSCYAGKFFWVNKYFPDYSSRLIITGSKHLLADRRNILVDDSDRNIDRFISYGGVGVLVPRVWNSKHKEASRSLEQTKKHLNQALKNGLLCKHIY